MEVVLDFAVSFDLEFAEEFASSPDDDFVSVFNLRCLRRCSFCLVSRSNLLSMFSLFAFDGGSVMCQPAISIIIGGDNYDHDHLHKRANCMLKLDSPSSMNESLAGWLVGWLADLGLVIDFLAG